MAKVGSVKITVVKKTNSKDVFGENSPATSDVASECDQLKVGQEFISDKGECPPGFCPWAFADIHRDIIHILMGGSYSWIKEKGVAISSCTDGLRPVIFKIEKIED